MQYKSKLIHFICIVVLFSALILPVSANTSFIIAGHLYGITDDREALERLTTKFKLLDPDYIFILGDSSLNKKSIYNYFNNHFKDRIYFSPGNHEIVDGSLKKYIENVGYTYKTIEADNIRFILINSLDSAPNINRYLKTAVKNNSKKMQIILTHHRLWDDSLTSSFPYQHDKSYYFQEIYPLISGRVKAIFAGNSNRQYFADYQETKGCSLQNVNNIYWVDQVGEIDGYSVGTGAGKPKLGFIFVEENNGHLLVEPHHINFQRDDLIPVDKLCTAPSSVTPNDPDSVKFALLWPIKHFFQSQRKQTVFLLGVVVGVVVLFLFYIFYLRVVEVARKSKK
jgi:calcineurin-like phosphoesterase family protein